MYFADDAIKNTKTQIRKTYTNLQKLHLKIDNRIRFILEKCVTNNNNTFGKELSTTKILSQ